MGYKQFIKELKAMQGLEKFNWYVLKPIALFLMVVVWLTL
jgi:hypothetical protein